MNAIKHFGQQIIRNVSGRTYFWGKDLGYFVHTHASGSSLCTMDSDLNVMLRKRIVDLDKARELMYNIKRELACVRLLHPNFGLTYPLILSAMFTDFFQNEPAVLDSGEPTYNLFMVKGDTMCKVGRNIYVRLKVYSSYAECLEEFAYLMENLGDEEQQFDEFYRVHPFSLTVYRAVFVLTLLLLKGENILAKENLGVFKKMDSLGYYRSSRLVPFQKGKIKREFFGKNRTYLRRPREA